MNLNDLHNLMDDLARKTGESESQLAAREAELRAALDEHPEWMDQMRSRDAFDERLCRVMPDVEIPEGLKDRLLTAVSEEQTPATPAIEPAHDRRSRRRAISMVTLASAMFVASVWMIFNPRTPPLTVAGVEDVLPQLWDQLETAGSETDPMPVPLPSGPWNSRRLNFPHAWKVEELSGESLAFRKLEFVSRRGQSHSGLLASLPKSSFAPESLPDTSYPFHRKPRYLAAADGATTLAVVSWVDTQTERVYFLAVPAEDHTLEALEDLLDVTPV